MSDLQRFTGAELLELRKRVVSAAIRFYTSASDYTRAQSELPELNTVELVRTWQDLRDLHAVVISAAQEQFELLTDIAVEYQRRAIEASTYAGPWHCMGCGADYYGDSGSHKCPPPVKHTSEGNADA